jgi:hypothetical protein
MSIKYLFAANGQERDYQYWGTHTSNSVNYTQGGVGVDSNNNVFTIIPNVWGNKLTITKQNELSRTLKKIDIPLTEYSNGTSLQIDSSNNVYVIFEEVAWEPEVSGAILIKLDNNLNITWQRKIPLLRHSTFGYYYVSTLFSMKVDASGNVYAVGSTISGESDGKVSIVKFNSSGTLQWHKTLGSPTGAKGGGCSVDASGNVYVCGVCALPTVGNSFLSKFNSSGVLQWTRSWKSAATGGNYAQSCVANSSNIFVIAAVEAQQMVSKSAILKFNSSGTLQWQRYISVLPGGQYGAATYHDPSEIHIDSSENIHVLFNGNGDGVWMKLNTSATVLFCMSLMGTLGGRDGYVQMAFDSTRTNVYFSGAYSNYVKTMKIAADGSKTGLWSGISGYEFASRSITPTIETSTWTINSPSLTSADGGTTVTTTEKTTSISSSTYTTFGL